MKILFSALLALAALMLPPSFARAGGGTTQVTPIVQVACAGDGFTYVDVEPFHGDASTLAQVRFVIDATSSTANYTVTNGSNAPASVDAEVGWFPIFSHELGGHPFTVGSYTYGPCGGQPVAPHASLTVHEGGSWGLYELNDMTGDYSPWADVDAPGGMHRVYLRSWDWADWTPGPWSSEHYGVRARYSLHVEYLSS